MAQPPPAFDPDKPEAGWRRGRILLPGVKNPSPGLISPDGRAFESMGPLPKGVRERRAHLRMYADYSVPAAGYEHHYVQIEGDPLPVVAQRYTVHPPQVYAEPPEWVEHLIRCPSQCWAKVQHGGIKATLYLRWRWEDPWQGHVMLDDWAEGMASIQSEWSPDLLADKGIVEGDVAGAQAALLDVGMAWLRARVSGAETHG